MGISKLKLPTHAPTGLEDAAAVLMRVKPMDAREMVLGYGQLENFCCHGFSCTRPSRQFKIRVVSSKVCA